MQKVINKNGLIGALDIGTSKVCCVLARPDSDNGAVIVGAGMHQCKGVSQGSIADLAQITQAVGAAMDAAEKSAGDIIEKVVCNAVVRDFSSELSAQEILLAADEVTDADITRLRMKAQEKIIADNQEILHCFPVTYSLDDNPILNDPRGLCGERLGIVLHTILCEKNPLRNEYKALEQCHLRCASVVASPYAAGLACLNAEELSQGAAVIDLGAGSTGIAVFKEGQLIYATALPVSSAHITHDVMIGLNTSFAEAERLKTLKGAAFAPQTYAFEEISVTSTGDEFASNRTRKDLTDIIIPRATEIFECVKKALQKRNLDKVCHNFVLTGGGSQLQSIRELASEVLKANVRLGQPIGIIDKNRFIPPAAHPLYMGCFGVLRHALKAQIDTGHKRDSTKKQSKVFQIFQWFLDNC